MNQEIQQALFSMQDQRYKDFTAPLVPNINPDSMIGIRIPLIKKYAKTINNQDKEEFLLSLPHQYHEGNILHAVLLSMIKDYDEYMKQVNAFLPYVTNWAVCDTLCNPYLSKHKSALIQEVYKWLETKEIYRVRYGVKCLMSYYLGDDFDPEHIDRVQRIHLDDYYVKMMVAWYLATGLAKNYDAFIKAIEERRFDTFTHNKAIQKAVESYRVSDEHKAYLKTLKIK